MALFLLFLSGRQATPRSFLSSSLGSRSQMGKRDTQVRVSITYLLAVPLLFFLLLPTNSSTYIILHTHKGHLVFLGLLTSFLASSTSPCNKLARNYQPCSPHRPVFIRLIFLEHTVTMIFIGHRPEEVASLRRPRQFFILRGIQFITASVFLVCLVNAATRLSQNGRGLFARSFLVTVAVSLSLSSILNRPPSVYSTGCESWNELLNHSWGNSHWW